MLVWRTPSAQVTFQKKLFYIKSLTPRKNAIPGESPRNGHPRSGKDRPQIFRAKKIKWKPSRRRPPNLHFMAKPAPKWGYPYFDLISLFGECPIFSGARKVESNFRSGNRNSTHKNPACEKLGTRRTAKSNQNMGTPPLGQVLT